MHSTADYLGPVAAEFLAAWSLLPKRDYVPDRQSFDPMTLPRILPALTILQRLADDEWRFRVIGTEIEGRWGRRLTGLNYTEIVAPVAAAIMRREFGEIVQRPCGSWSTRRVEFTSGKLVMVETLRLPLRAKDGSSSLILSCSCELPGRTTHGRDQPRTIISMVQQRFLDIGAGVCVESILARQDGWSG